MCGYDVFFLTGVDEHGQKIERRAIASGKSPQAYVDYVTGAFKKLWAELDISNDHFIRTTDPEHVRVVQHVFQKLYDSGDIYQGRYEAGTARHARHSSSNLSLLRVTAQIAGAVSNGCRRRATSSVFRSTRTAFLPT